jgi:hypothetical protein
MTGAPSIPLSLPPRLSMDEYADFVEASIRESNPALAAKQKHIEKQIREPFRMTNPELHTTLNPTFGVERHQA